MLAGSHRRGGFLRQESNHLQPGGKRWSRTLMQPTGGREGGGPAQTREGGEEERRLRGGGSPDVCVKHVPHLRVARSALARRIGEQQRQTARLLFTSPKIQKLQRPLTPVHEGFHRDRQTHRREKRRSQRAEPWGDPASKAGAPSWVGRESQISKLEIKSSGRRIAERTPPGFTCLAGGISEDRCSHQTLRAGSSIQLVLAHYGAERSAGCSRAD